MYRVFPASYRAEPILCACWSLDVVLNTPQCTAVLLLCCSLSVWRGTLQVSGEFVRGKEKLPCTLAGAWDKEVHVNMPDGSKRKLWQTYPMPKAESRQAVPAPPMSFTDITHMISKHVQDTSCTHILHKSSHTHLPRASFTQILHTQHTYVIHLHAPFLSSKHTPHTFQDILSDPALHPSFHSDCIWSCACIIIHSLCASGQLQVLAATVFRCSASQMLSTTVCLCSLKFYMLKFHILKFQETASLQTCEASF